MACNVMYIYIYIYTQANRYHAADPFPEAGAFASETAATRGDRSTPVLIVGGLSYLSEQTLICPGSKGYPWYGVWNQSP